MELWNMRLVGPQRFDSRAVSPRSTATRCRSTYVFKRTVGFESKTYETICLLFAISEKRRKPPCVLAMGI